VKKNKSILLILLGIIVISFAILNFFVNIPEYFTNLQLEHSLSNNALVPKANTYAQNDPPTILETITPVPELAPAINQQLEATLEPTSPAASINGYIPDRIVIPAIHLDAPVVQSEKTIVELRDQWFEQWIVPNEFAAGWQANSAPLGMVGNTVLGGHHNEYGKVFAYLVELNIGDLISVYSGKIKFTYRVVNKLLLPERDVSLEIRKANAEWIAPTRDERLTLVTCWPKRNNTHRVIIVAEPVVDSQSMSVK
jgi:sortase A